MAGAKGPAALPASSQSRTASGFSLVPAAHLTSVADAQDVYLAWNLLLSSCYILSLVASRIIYQCHVTKTSPDNLYDLIPCHWATSPTVASPQTSGQPRLLPYPEKNSQALKTLCSSSVQMPISAFPLQLQYISSQTPLLTTLSQECTPTTYYGIQLVFSRAKLQTAVRSQSSSHRPHSGLSGKISLCSSL